MLSNMQWVILWHNCINDVTMQMCNYASAQLNGYALMQKWFAMLTLSNIPYILQTLGFTCKIQIYMGKVIVIHVDGNGRNRLVLLVQYAHACIHCHTQFYGEYLHNDA